MSKFRILGLAIIALALGLSAPAIAKECKSDLVVAKGKMKLTKIIAYPSSLFAWRKAANKLYGRHYHSWRRAAQRDIECERVTNDYGKRRWQCTRTALPCAKDGRGDGNPGNGGANYDLPPYPGHILQLGSSGDDVVRLQRLLDDAGYQVDVDGDFGSKTRAAVVAFQKTEAIQVDGVVGRETWDRIAG